MISKVAIISRRNLSYLALLALFTFPRTNAAQTAPPQVAVGQPAAQERLQPTLDLAQFQDSKRVSYLDISYAVPLPVLHGNGTATAQPEAFEIILDLRVYRNDSLWATKAWKLEEKKSAPATAEARRELVDRLRYVLSGPATYRAVLYTRGLQQPATIDSASATLHARAFSDNQVEVSDVLLASEIRRSAAQSMNSAIRNAYDIFPNPRNLYGESVPTLYYYFEVYNMFAGLKGASYKCYWRVENESGALVEGLGQSYRTRKKQNDFSVEMGSISVAALSTGGYTFVYGIADSAQNLQASSRKKFYVYNPSHMSSASSDPAESALAHAAVAELDDEFTRMRHIVVRDEKKTYQSLTNAEAKRRFILSLWETHKPAEYPNGLDYRRLYLARAREADARFTTVLRPGWNSDQGRVYILYGVPSNIEREPSNPTLKPHEIWRYDEIQGGVIFVFADRTGFKNYELIHSSHRNELQNPDWQRLITFEADTQGLQ